MVKGLCLKTPMRIVLAVAENHFQFNQFTWHILKMILGRPERERIRVRFYNRYRVG